MAPSTSTIKRQPRNNTIAVADATALAEWNSKKWVWITDAQAGYVMGWVVKEEGELSTVAVESGQAVRKIPTLELSRVNPPTYDGSEDIADLTYLNEASVVHNIRTRYMANSIYTYSGLFLVAVNPYKALTIYTPKVIESYKNRRRDENPPHVYAVAEKAWQNMLAHRDQSQSVLVTGESGAGKTENTKKVIQYLAAIAADPLPSSSSFDLLVTRSTLLERQASIDRDTGKKLGALERQILQANPILEAFGNAQTVKNNNSSRFGKFVRIYFNSIGAIAGANIDWYLLEKSRVTARSEFERSFHVFFQLLRGADPSLKAKLLLKGGPQDYEFLKKSRLDVDRMDDKEEWKLLLDALNTVGFTTDEQYDLFKVIAAILHLGNIVVGGDRSDQAFIRDVVQLEKVCFLLGLDDAELLNALVRPKIKSGRDWVVQARTQKQVVDELAALSKSLYEKNFGAMVERINTALGRPSTKTFIGVLDIAGFEIFDVNGFEQLCINLTNEKLQQFFNHHMFVLEQEEYTREEIDWEFLNFGAELQPTIDLIESNNPMGILSCLDDACIMPRATDATFTNKLHQLAAEKPIATQFTKYSAARFDLGFTVSHYAGEVEYRTDGWLDKNRDPLNDNITSLLAASSDPHTARLFAEYAEDVDSHLSVDYVVKPRLRRGAFRTVGQRHKDQLAFLMTQLRETQPHFVRCLVPNLTKSPGQIDTPLVLDQLRCNGVLEGIRIARLGYPNRLPFSEFRRRFELLTPGVVAAKASFMDGGKACEKMLAVLELDPRAYKLGLSKVFFKAGILAELEERRDEYLGDIFTRIQAAVRGFVGRRLANKVLNRAAAVRTIQRNARLYIQLRDWPWWPLFQRVRPLLAAARSDDEMRRKEAELLASRERAEREAIERTRLEKVQVELETQSRKMEAELASQIARTNEKDGLLLRAQAIQSTLEEELRVVQADLEVVDQQLERAMKAKAESDSYAQDLTTSLASSTKLIDTLTNESLVWKRKEAEMMDQTSVKTEEWQRLLAEKETNRTRAMDLERKLAEAKEDYARESERYKTSLGTAEKKLVAAVQEGTELKTKVGKVEAEARTLKEAVMGLQKEKREREGVVGAKEVELNRLIAERAVLLEERDIATKSSTDLEIRLAAATKLLDEQTRTLKSISAAQSRSDEDVRSLKKLLDDKVSDHQRQAESNQIAELALADLKLRLSKVTSELTIAQRDATKETTKLRLDLDSINREAIESKRKNDELGRTASATSAKLARAEDLNQELERKVSNYALEMELVRTKATEATLKDRERWEKEIARSAEKLRSLEDSSLRVEREKATALREIESLRVLWEEEKQRVVEVELKSKSEAQTIAQQYALLADFDKVNANLRSELVSTQARLKVAEAKAGRTVVEHIRVLEEAQRLQNAEIDRIRSDSTERDAYVRTLERARAALTQSLEDLQHEREAERRQQFVNSKAPKDNAVARAQDAYESEKKLRQLAELNVARLRSEVQHQQSQLESSAREAIELRRANTLFERELNTLAASDVVPTGELSGRLPSMNNLRSNSPTKNSNGFGSNAGSNGIPPSASRRRNYE